MGGACSSVASAASAVHGSVVDASDAQRMASPTTDKASGRSHEKRALVYLAITQAAADSATAKWQGEDELSQCEVGDARHCPKHLLFSRLTDAEEFKDWMRHCHESQVVDLTVRSHELAAGVSDEDATGMPGRFASRLKPQTIESM